MFDMISYRLFEVCLLALSNLYLLTFYHASTLSFITGLIAPSIYFDKPEKMNKAHYCDALLSFSLSWV
ncbi:hypothetical protein JCM19232_4965 [Vibrio ishigakensis]|uniref:Uncharacterized protein n=1 Tax=Vibrio ishigakensis TaxID=1481914 RepID=A0A0B8PEW3_9VIBR|nr:hypothetical protein JCM19232_4965 [Vibrio ishigakensis]